ncbi:Murein DD-endopeptidase MepM and murein hydrolase activator NlpD, contain LysM domain [Parapedobacter composti]|uniref:Murein DD-endopeptidase MepM and murein hydrolase activator NlpD, contain LysM domain n=1 Tax=Parapedobacter composti TaxID=623281 RepID=A0A1I1E2Q4_9SPHI|nr:M23 family metallopeptidase [Parapedobacter composti]SFB81559.1 Murein DD-endopeptidase MepM and murein hydrolase activator NlpD, contain LysM domain [Parapedobacter composti]
MAKQKKSLPKLLNARYKLVVLHEETFEEKAAFTGRLWSWLTGAVTAAAVLVVLTVILIRSTALREYVIGTSLSSEEREMLTEAYARLDSMEQVAQANDIYLTNLRQVISGQAGETLEDASRQQAQPKNNIPANEPDISVSDDELALRELVESGAPYELPENQQNARTGISSYTFYSPIKGIISADFSAKDQHYAIDIAVKMNEPVRATLSGHVLFASYTPETGYVAIIQHGNNLVSLYKHCASIIKKVGSFVRGGEVIAFAGDTGELSTGPHLHFELWYNGSPVNPNDYIAF